MKITRRQLRKLIMEMPMGGYFGSMHGGTGEDFISAVEMEAMKYPEYSIYIDDASNSPNEFVISSSRRDDAMGPQSHYLTSIHVEVQDRDGMVYIDGQPFSSYAQAAAQILADLEDERKYSIMSESINSTGKRRQLRRLIETRIKPNIPNVPSEELLGKIDNFARDPEMQPDADSFAGSFGYPEDRSYVEDLKTYDAAGRMTFDTVLVHPAGQTETEVVTVGIPYELVDKVIEAHEDVTSEEGNMNSSRYAIPYDELRDAGSDIFRHIHDQLDDKYGRNGYDIYSYGVNGAHGYFSDEYQKAMEKMGDVL